MPKYEILSKPKSNHQRQDFNHSARGKGTSKQHTTHLSILHERRDRSKYRPRTRRRGSHPHGAPISRTQCPRPHKVAGPLWHGDRLSCRGRKKHRNFLEVFTRENNEEVERITLGARRARGRRLWPHRDTLCRHTDGKHRHHRRL